jgi:hypothetical protein
MRLQHLRVAPTIIHAFKWVPTAQLRPHERTRPDVTRAMVQSFRRGAADGPGKAAVAPTMPAVLACARTMTILDGHHRHAMCTALGIGALPTLLLNYEADDIVLLPHTVSKADVLAAGAETIPLFDPKDTTHSVRDSDGTSFPLAVLSPTCVYS